MNVLVVMPASLKRSGDHNRRLANWPAKRRLKRTKACLYRVSNERRVSLRQAQAREKLLPNEVSLFSRVEISPHTSAD